MRFLSASLLVGLSFSLLLAQPDFFVHNPAGAGVNNTFFHNSLVRKMAFVYTVSELDAVGMSGPQTITSLWFRHNVVRTVNLSNFRVSLGHTTHTSPVVNIANNFNVSGPDVVRSDASYSYVSLAGTWNDPGDSWTEIPLTSAFNYDGLSNLVVLIEFSSSSNSTLTFYAGSGTTRYAGSTAATSFTSSTNRPVLGFSTGEPLPIVQTPQLSLTPLAAAVQLHWTAGLSTHGYTTAVERQLTSQGWEEIQAGLRADIRAYQDALLPPVGTRYRLRLTDENGRAAFSNLVEYLPEPGSRPLRAYPNPVQRGGVLHFSGLSDAVSFTFLDVLGQRVAHVRASSLGELVLPENLGPGLYWAQPEHGPPIRLMVLE